jgi:hypothetical protein
VKVILVGMSDEPVEVDEVDIEFADNGEHRTLVNLKAEVRGNEVRVQDIEARPLKKIRVKCKSPKIRGGRGEFRIEIIVLR